MALLDSLLQPLTPLLDRLGVPELSRADSALWVLFFCLVFVVLFIVFLRGALKPTSLQAPQKEVAVSEVKEDEPSSAPSVEADSAVAEAPVTLPQTVPVEENEAVATHAEPVEELSTVDDTPANLLDRMRKGLSKTHQGLVGRVDQLLRGRKQIDEDLLEDLEEILVTADLGVTTTQRLVGALEERLDRGGLGDADQLRAALKEEILSCLTLDLPEVTVPEGQPKVILMTGVNGVGKTTTIGKLACRFSGEGQKVVLGAGDTFRAAAAEQLGIWAERAGCDLIRHDEGADPGAVVFDAVKAAVARNADTLMLDTAGRLHNKAHLMEELKKVRRVVDRELPGAPHMTLLVLDATTGQNALNQAKLFREAVQVDGIVLTKLDGTAKGGVVIAIAAELGMPVYYVGIGEGMEDLRPFEADVFVDALFGEE